MLPLVVVLLTCTCSFVACGGGTSPVDVRNGSPAEREWIDNTRALIRTLRSDILLSASGGANLATARRALSDQSAVYTMLVAYSLFGDCGHSLAGAGLPSRRTEATARTLASACRRLERASALFQKAMTRRDPAALLEATRTAEDATPLLVGASSELDAVR